MSFLPIPVPVESFTRVRESVPPAPVPRVGLSWGQTAKFSVLDPADRSGESESEEADRRGGLTIRWAPERVYRDQTYDMPPVWREYDVARVESEDDPEVTLDVSLTRSMLFPLGTQHMKYVGGGSYVVDDGGQPYQERIVHSFVRLDMPPPDGEWNIVETGLVEGQWPSYREEMFSPGKFVGAMAWQTVFGSGMKWTR